MLSIQLDVEIWGDNKDRSLNLGKVRVLIFFKTTRLEGEARGHDMHSTMKIFIKFSEADSVHNCGVKIIFLPNVMQKSSLKFHIETSYLVEYSTAFC